MSLSAFTHRRPDRHHIPEPEHVPSKTKHVQQDIKETVITKTAVTVHFLLHSVLVTNTAARKCAYTK